MMFFEKVTFLEHSEKSQRHKRLMMFFEKVTFLEHSEKPVHSLMLLIMLPMTISDIPKLQRYWG